MLNCRYNRGRSEYYERDIEYRSGRRAKSAHEHERRYEDDDERGVRGERREFMEGGERGERGGRRLKRLYTVEDTVRPPHRYDVCIITFY